MAKPEPHYIDIDLKLESQYYVPLVTQNDTNVIFIARVTDSGRGDPDILDGFNTVTLTSKRMDGKRFYIDGEKIDGTNQVKFKLGTSELQQAERVKATVQLYNADGRITSANFDYDVQEDLTGDYEPSDRESGLIETVLTEGPEVIRLARLATEAANQSTQLSDASRALTESATTRANTATSNANNAASDLEDLKDTVIAVKNETQLVQDATTDEREATSQVRTDTIAVKNATDKVRTDTIAVKNATDTVRTNTELVRQGVISDNADLQALKTDVTNVKNATDTVRTDTIQVKDDTLLVKGQTEQALVDIGTLKNETQTAKEETLQAKTLTETATTNANSARDAALLVANNTVHKGTYSPTVAYKKNNVVTYNGSSYMATNNTTGNLPTNTTYWRLLAQRGIDGSGSVSTVNGVGPNLDGNVDLEIFHIDSSPPTDTKKVWIDLSV